MWFLFKDLEIKDRYWRAHISQENIATHQTLSGKSATPAKTDQEKHATWSEAENELGKNHTQIKPKYKLWPA